jgi:SSS family solute:Na+ symporter
MSLGIIDILVVAVYFILIAAIGIYVSRGQNTTAKFFVAGQSIPGWVVAFTLMGTIIGTGTFVGHPGTSYQKGLILLFPHLLLPIVLLFVAKVIVPFYRRVVHMSAYEYIGKRFGLGGRLYTSFGFLADRTFDIGVTLVTTAIAVNVLTGWELRTVIVGVTLFTAAYTMLGGIKAVVWTDVAQGTILILGGTFLLGRLLFAPEAGAPFAVVGEAWRGGRLSFGSWEFSWRSLFDTQTTTAWLFLITYMVQWSRRYITDQHLVQRYLIARTDAEASKATFTGALICVPVFFTFMFIGSCLYGFFALAKVPGPELGDNVMPFFMSHYLPTGLLGLVVAAILAAAMSTTSSDLNSVATVATTDYFAIFFPKASDKARLLFGRTMIFVGGVLAAMCAVLLIPEKGLAPVMERAVTIAAILSGGTLGLFTLGFATRTATRRGCYVGMASCLVFMTWAILSQPKARLVDFGFNFDMNPILIGIFGHLVLFTTGWIASRLFGGYLPDNVEDLTFWSHKLRADAAAAAAQKSSS